MLSKLKETQLERRVPRADAEVACRARAPRDARPAPPPPTTRFASVAPLVAEHADLERQLADPALHADAGAREARRPALRRARADRRRARRLAAGCCDDLEAARELGAEDQAFAAEVPDLETAEAEAAGEAAPPADPARPGRRPRRHPRDQGGGGRRGVGAVRRRPAAHVPALRGVEGLEDRAARAHRERPRRLQGRAGRDQGLVERPGRGRLGAPQVRGRRAPRAAGAEDRVAGPHPHLRRRACSSSPRSTSPRRSRSTRTT